MEQLSNPHKKNKRVLSNQRISTKLFDGFSICFRQWRDKDNHCKFLHGYSVSFKVWFQGELDHRNWVWDFGGMTRASSKIQGMNPKKWMDYMFDHTTIVAQDDPLLDEFYKLEKLGLIQLRVLPQVSAEKFAELIFYELNSFLKKETNGRVTVKRVEFMENRKNSAIVEIN